MKRVIQILFGYVIFCFCVCLAIGLFTGAVPELLAESVKTYRLYSGLRLFCRILPAVTITGFIIGCSVSFGRNPEGSVMRFSPSMFGRYQHVIITGLICSFILTAAAEIGTPLLGSKQHQLEQMPKLVREYVRIGTNELVSGDENLAFQYAQLALKIDPNSDEAQQLDAKAENAIKPSGNNGYSKAVPEISPGVSEEGYSVSELRKRAEDAYAKGNWFDAHYYAQTGILVASPKDTNVELLRQTAVAAWNKLSGSDKPGETEEERLYKRKLDGYKSLMDGDNLKAYYIFKTLSMESRTLSIDPDVVRYLGLAGSRLNTESFFIDETFNMQEFETANNVYFTIRHKNGSTDIVYIKGVTPMHGVQGTILYLRGFSIFSVDKSGAYVQSMYVQYAKMLEVPVSDFDNETRMEYGIDGGMESVPYILFRSIDRNTEGIVNKPLYRFAKDGTNDEKTQLVLPVPYDDIQLLLEVSKGAEFMNIPSLFQFAEKAVQYGYSQEVFGQVMLNRLLYPLFMLIIIVCSASFAWNYRIGEKLMFKAVWMFVFPVFSVLAYVLFEVFLGLYKLINYVFLGVSGQHYALVAGCGIYISILIIVSIVFLARNSADEA